MAVFRPTGRTGLEEEGDIWLTASVWRKGPAGLRSPGARGGYTWRARLRSQTVAGVTRALALPYREPLSS